MKNKKLLKAIAATIVCSAMGITAFSFAACDPVNGGDDSGDTTHYHTYSTDDDWAYDGNYHWRYATCEHTDKIKGKEEHTWGTDDKCTECKAPRQIIRPTLSEEDEEQPEKNPDGTINVKYDFNSSDCNAGTSEQDVVSGIFTVKSGTEIRSKTPAKLYSYDETNGKQFIKDVPEYTKSVKIGGSADCVEINAPAEGTLVMHVGNGSGTTLSNQLWLTKPDGGQEPLSYYAEGSSGPCVEIALTFDKAGKYKITRQGGTSDIYYLSYSAKVEDSPIENIGVAATGTANYFVGQEFSASGLAVNATHETTGRISPVDSRRLLIDYANFNSKKSGTYEIFVSYTKAGKEYKTSFNVNVYSFEDLALGTDKIVKEKNNTSAGNGVYANHSLRQFYFTGETLSTDGISVVLNGMIDGKTQDFLLGEKDYKVSEVDMSTAGKKTVIVSYTTGGTTKSKTFEIIVADKDSDLATATEVKVAVNAATTDANVGIKNGDNAYQFQTIHQALDFLNNSGLSKTAKKTMTLAAGTYWEKLEITVPNLTIEGAGKDATKIEYDALYGVKDASGFEHTTDSTATLNVREAAENFTIKNVTVSNYYNSVESYVGAASGDHRALALLVQSDKFTMDSCALLGYQDTVEFFTGRQFIVNSYISGTTDFIFGTNNTTYFYNCEIHSITNGNTDGGYITAFKGNNKDANDAVTYGAIFDKCHFTADAEVVANGNTAIGRPWGAYAAVAVINSEIDGHVSTTTSTHVKNERYVTMSGVKPTDATVKFVEYNNTGDGAIDTAVSGMRFLGDDEAKNYSDFATIFGTVNGKVTYSSVWMPVKPGVQTYDVTVTAVTDDGNVNLGTLTVEEGQAILEDQIKALVADNEVYKTYDIVGVYSDEGCLTDYDYSAVAADGNVYVKLHFETAFTSSTTINFKTGANYATLAESGKLVVVAPTGFDSPYKEIKNDCIGFNEGATLSFDVKAGTTISIDAYGGNYTNFTVKIDDVLKTDITGAAAETGVLTDDCSFTVDSNCTVTIVCGANNYLKSISIDVPKTYAIGETITLTDYDGASLESGASGKWNGITITTDNGGKFASRVPGNNDIQCAVGTVLTFNVAAGVTADNITVISYQNTPVAAGTWTVTVTDGVATVECVGTASNHQYIMAIEIKEVTP